jgi:hypothetical protein
MRHFALTETLRSKMSDKVLPDTLGCDAAMRKGRSFFLRACDWHPSATTNARMATLRTAELKTCLSW